MVISIISMGMELSSKSDYLKRQEVKTTSFLRLEPGNYSSITQAVFYWPQSLDSRKGTQTLPLKGRSGKEFGSYVFKTAVSSSGKIMFLGLGLDTLRNVKSLDTQCEVYIMYDQLAYYVQYLALYYTATYTLITPRLHHILQQNFLTILTLKVLLVKILLLNERN